MALEPRRLFIDVQSRTFISSPNSNLPSAAPAWVDEDVESVEIYALRPTTDIANPFIFTDLSAATVKFAVGSTTPAALQTSFSALPTTVTTAVTEVQAGGTFGGTVDEIQKITFSGATPYSGTYGIKFPVRTFAASVSGKTIVAANHGLYSGQSVRLSNVNGTLTLAQTRDYRVLDFTQDTFTVSETSSAEAAGGTADSATCDVTVAEIVTPSIAWNATISQVQAAIVAAGFAENEIPQVLVSGTNGEEIELYYGGRNGRAAYPNVVIVNSSLKGAPGVSANVSYNTQEIAALVSAGTTNVTMEVEISEGAIRQTFRQGATLSADLITSTSPSPLPSVTANSFALQSPNGSVFTITVTNAGELTIAAP